MSALDAEAKRLSEIEKKEGTAAAIKEMVKTNPAIAKIFHMLLETTPGAKNFVALGFVDENKAAAFEIIVHRAGRRMPSYKEICKTYTEGTKIPPKKDVCDNCDGKNGCCMYDYAVQEGIDKEWGCCEYTDNEDD